MLADTGEPLGSKVCKRTTRLPGWEGRTREVIRRLASVAARIRDCPRCGDSLLHVYKVRRNTPNKGRWFLSCPECDYFEWLDAAGVAR